MAIQRTTFYGNQFIGLFAQTNDSVTLIGNTALPKFETVIKNLGTKPVKFSAANSDLVGLYVVMNNNGILISGVADEPEIDLLKSRLKDVGSDLNVFVTNTKFVALGNNILLNDKGALVNPDIDDNLVKEIKDVLGVEVERGTLGEYKTVGAMAVANNAGLLSHPHTEEDEMNFIEDVLKVDGGVGTANQGVPFLSISLLVNNKEAIFGEDSTGFEIGRAQEALGLIE